MDQVLYEFPPMSGPISIGSKNPHVVPIAGQSFEILDTMNTQSVNQLTST